MTTPELPMGSIAWRDLTVPDAAGLRDFYAAVTGWRFGPHPMEGYDDYMVMLPGSDEVIAGLCHARGPNAAIPPQWLLYVTVASVDDAVRACGENGGEVVVAPRSMGSGRFAVIRDPAGAVLGLWQSVS